MPPNIVIYLADDLAFDDLGCYGSTDKRTPHLDALAAAGARFTDFHANAPMCSPSRAALLTGRYQQRAALEFVLGPDPALSPGMPSDEPTFAHMLGAAGYATGMFGKYHTGHIPLQSPRRMGFGIYRGNNGGMDHHARFNRWGEATWYHDETVVEQEAGYSTDLICDHALHFIREHRDQPFVCYLADWMVHFPWQGPNDPADFAKGVDCSDPAMKYGSVTDRRRAYREMVEAMDASVGRIIATLDELGLRQDTLFIFTSDNGGHELVSDNTPLRGAKGSIYEGGHRVPAVANWPGRIAPGTVLDAPAMLHDLLPTMLDAAAVEPPVGRHLDGHSLLPAMTGHSTLPDRLLFWRHGHDHAVRDGDWKLTVNAAGTALYDLGQDLSETTDLAAQQPEIVARLTAAYAAWEQDVSRDEAAAKLRRNSR